MIRPPEVQAGFGLGEVKLEGDVWPSMKNRRIRVQGEF